MPDRTITKVIDQFIFCDCSYLRDTAWKNASLQVWYRWRGWLCHVCHKVSLIMFRYVSSRADEDGRKLIMPIFIIARSWRRRSWFWIPPEKCIRTFLESILSTELMLVREAMFLFTL